MASAMSRLTRVARPVGAGGAEGGRGPACSLVRPCPPRLKCTLDFTVSPGRHAHVYLFAWHPIADRDLADHRQIEQWAFYLIRSTALPPGQETIRLSVLNRLGARCASASDFGDILDELRRSIGLSGTLRLISPNGP